MKKNLLIITCLFTLFGCTKNSNTNVPTNADQKKSNDLSITPKAGADSLSKTDTTKNGRNKIVNNVSCAYSKIYSSPYASSYYTVIANFPPNTTGASVVIPKGTWRAGAYAFNNQGDGNLVVYKFASGEPLWGSSNTYGRNTKVVLQPDLNLVVYDNATGVGVFESQTYYFRCGDKNPRDTKLVLTVDGDLSIIAVGRATFGPVTVTLATTRTFGGVHSPNDGSFFKDYTTSGGGGGVSFVY
ncbi:D-mannose binding lectin [Mucilaginibacter lappiensis]|uniref:Bulb-type lectin domain-containing protein n=1 Tax=Mucilaginibacter lappiensis TaxID=354630 RepID=A0ABR6PN55_9SPHI|nr:hypothetical protein [Mucilaginibacter lappiensis]MBB6111212.1 hypothetical protein [Mucilaginibacter lappiensis]SIR73073.1 D-mannose binding lectin [Mucilaginibacter lappiensis]